MNKIWVVGLGPGHMDYLLPIGLKKLKAADIVIGGQRHLESLEIKGEKVILKIPLTETIDYIRDNFNKKQIAVLVSGDTGFYSFLETLNRYFDTSDLETYPGISSLQYMFSKLNMSYQDALISSVHGRSFDLKDMFAYKRVGLLTDMKKNPKFLFDYLKDHDKKAKLYVGENLSYDNELITVWDTEGVIPDQFDKLCVVVIEFE